MNTEYKIVVFQPYARDSEYYHAVDIELVPQNVSAEEWAQEMESRYTCYMVLCELPVTDLQAASLRESFKIANECASASELASKTDAIDYSRGLRLAQDQDDDHAGEDDDMSWAQ